MAGTLTDPARLVAYMQEKGSSASVAAACCSRMVALAPDPSLESIAHLKAFVEAGGVQEVVRLMKEHAQRGSSVGQALSTEVLALADVQEQGCVLLMNLAGLALSGDDPCASALHDQKAAVAVVGTMNQYSEKLELVEGAMAALMQLATLDVPGCMEAGLAEAVVRSMHSCQASGWLHFLCARTLSWCLSTGGVSVTEALCGAGAAEALVHVLRSEARDPGCGDPYGVPELPGKLQVMGRASLAALAGDAAVEEAGGVEKGLLKVALFLVDDLCVLSGLGARPELNGCGGRVIAGGAGGLGADAASGRYGVRIELPLVHRGTLIRVRLENLRLAPHSLAAQITAITSGPR